MIAKILLLSVGVARGALDADDPVVVGKTFMAGSEDPRAGSTAWSLTSHGIAEKLFTVDQHGDIVGQVADSVAKVSEYVWDVTLKAGYKFSDGTDVDAQHVADCLSELNTENPSAQSSLGAMTVTAPDAKTVRIESERQTHVMDAVLAEWVFVVYYVDAGGNFVYTGPFAVEAFHAGSHINLVPNEFYADAADRPPVIIERFPDGHDLAAAVGGGDVDVAFHLPVDTLADLRAQGTKVKSFEVGYHYMAFHNVKAGAMSDVRVREAIDLAIDRDALSQDLLGGVGTRSLFPDYTPYFQDGLGDSHGDLDAAGAKLDEAGWTLDASTGKRTKDGQDLVVDVVAYRFRPDLGKMQPEICRGLEALGVTCNAIMTMDGSREEDDDWTEVTNRLAEGDWDLLMWAQNTLPAGDPAWFLNSFFRTDGGNNHAGLSSPVVDDLLDALAVAEDHTARVAATADAHAAILAEMPVSNLVTPAWHVGLSDRMADYEPWGSDYYVIRADLLAPPTPEPAPAAPSPRPTSEPAPPTPEPGTKSKKKSDDDNALAIGLGVGAAALVCAAVAATACGACGGKRREKSEVDTVQPDYKPAAEQIA